MLEWFLDLLPWWVWLALALVSVFAVWRFLGTKAALAAAAALSALLFYKRGRQEGRADIKDDLKEQDNERAIDIRDVAGDARAESDRINANPERLRDSDGFRRD